MDIYQQRKQRLAKQLKEINGGSIGLAKRGNTSNLFRNPDAAKQKLDVRDFNHVLEVNTHEGWVEVEGMTIYADLVSATLPHGVMPTVVPQLRSITVGGAASGGGIEASSFKFGFVHETVLEMEILLPNGEVVLATPDNQHQDLFFGFPVSYGTLGYALKLKVKTNPVRPYVKLRHIRHSDPEKFFAEIKALCQRDDIDFIDGVIFAEDEMYITVGTFTDSAPYSSDYTFENIFYKSIRAKKEDYLATEDFIWRWDTDWFWCSNAVYAQNPVVRRLLGKSRLNSVTYTRLMRLSAKWGIGSFINHVRGLHAEAVIQDVEIPVKHAAAFLDFFHKDIGIKPIWVCPTKAYRSDVQFPLYRTHPDTLYINFGFWDVVKTRAPHPPGYFNKKIEAKVGELGGMKSLYSDVFYEPDQFWEIYNRPAYDQVKTKYDPQGKFPNLYQRCVQGIN